MPDHHGSTANVNQNGRADSTGARRESSRLGFAIRYNGVNYATTARHCDSAYKSYDISTTKLISTKFVTADGGAKLLNTTGRGGMFYGNISSTLKAKVVPYPRTGGMNAGDYVCTSGGNSGTHCGGSQIQQVKGSIKWNDGYGNLSVLVAERADLGLAAVQGDSGGPVYRNKTSTEVYAVGMIQAVQTNAKAPCGAVKKSGGACSYRVFYTSINTITRAVPGSSIVYG